MPSNYVLHSDPVWRERANFIINAPIVVDGVHDGRFEQLWTNQQGESFELCCIPFFLYDVALGDFVSVVSGKDGSYQYGGVMRSSGRHLFRVWFGDVEDHVREDVMRKLARFPVLLETHGENLVAIDIGDAGLVQNLADYLMAEENAGRLVYETGVQNSS
jgi:hypothetical protein